MKDFWWLFHGSGFKGFRTLCTFCTIIYSSISSAIHVALTFLKSLNKMSYVVLGYGSKLKIIKLDFML